MVNASRDFMSLVNRELRYEAVNEAFCESYGKCRDDIVGMPVEKAWAGTPVLTRLLPGFEACFRGETSVLRMRHDFGDRLGERDLEFTFNPYRSSSGEVTRAVVVTKDVTDYLETQRQLSSAREKADVANETKGIFLAGMSHEVRTPLNAVIGLTELTLRLPLMAEQRENLETVLVSAHSLLDLINDILDLSKIEAGRMTLERVDFDLPDRIEAALRSFRPAALSKGLSLELVVDEATPRGVAGDPIKLGQIVMNLVGNALKFTEKGGVVVRVAPLPPGTKSLFPPSGPGGERGSPEHRHQGFGQGHGHRHREGQARGHLRELLPGRLIGLEALWGHGPRPLDLPQPRGPLRRDHSRQVGAGEGQRVLFHRLLRARQARAPRMDGPRFLGSGRGSQARYPHRRG